MVSAYLLVSHGSRDPRPQEAANQLAAEFKRRLDNSQANSRGLHQLSLRAQAQENNSRKEPESSSIGRSISTLAVSESLVGTATLELSLLPLHEEIYRFGRSAIALGCKHLQILPLFLLPGVHVIEDIPAAVALAQTALDRDLQINLQPHIGDRIGFQQLFVDRMATLGGETKILLSHGSRRLGGNQPVIDLAARTAAEVAYWSMSPTLAERVTSLVEIGYRQIAIQPYFLFAGGITDAIAQQVKTLQQQFPHVELILGQPIEWPSLLEAIAISYG